MDTTKNNGIAAAVIAAANSIFPVLNLAGITHLTSDGISIVMLCVTNFVTLGGLVYALSKKPAPPA